jgi:hypothetical protein
MEHNKNVKNIIKQNNIIVIKPYTILTSNSIVTGLCGTDGCNRLFYNSVNSLLQGNHYCKICNLYPVIIDYFNKNNLTLYYINIKNRKTNAALMMQVVGKCSIKTCNNKFRKTFKALINGKINKCNYCNRAFK